MKKDSQHFLQFKERTQHGNDKFPLQLYHQVTHTEKGLIFHNHWHDEAELFYVTEGEIDLVVDEVAFSAKEQTMVLIPPNIIHGAYLSKDKKACFSSIVFHPDFISSKRIDKIQTTQLDPFLTNTFHASYILKIDDFTNVALKKAFQSFQECYHSHHHYAELAMKGYLFQMLFFLLKREREDPKKLLTNSLNEERKKKILTFISDHYQDDMNLNDLAHVLSLSKEQFCRFFKQSFHTTPMHYLTQFRLNHATELLKNSHSPITTIALDVGFTSSNYFTVVFKKMTGMTPSEYRKLT